MNTNLKVIEPKLDKPGAGIPLFERLIAKYIIFPRRFRTTTPAQGIEQFERETQKIIQLSRSLSEDEMCERRLVPRLPGLEDSSRYWSVAMAIEHLVIVGVGTRNIVSSLSGQKTHLPQTKIENVKPHPDVDAATIIARFETMSSNFARTAREIDFSVNTGAKHVHPWFGPLDARQWLLFAAPHQRIHRKQIEEIIKRL